MLHVTNADVERLLTVTKTVELVQAAYVKLARGRVENPPRVVLSVPIGSTMYFMPAHVHGQQTVTVKVARVNPSNSAVNLPTVLLTLYMYDAITGTQTAEIEGERLTAARTAASSLLATNLLAKKDARVLGIYGSGTQAESHILAFTSSREFDKVIVYSRNEKRRTAFVNKISRVLNVPVIASQSPDRVAEESDVIVTATTSAVPVLDGKLVRPGTHVNAIGGAARESREVDTTLVKRSRVVVDSLSQALSTYGDIMAPINEGAIQGSEILELGKLLKDAKKFARRVEDITLFKSGGLAALDAMVADFVVKSMQSGESPNK